MAFSTQKDFFNVPFLDETVEFECVDHCLKIKTYGSTFDDRSWAAGDTQQSKFLYDLVNCLTPGGQGGEGAGLGDGGAGQQRGRGRDRPRGASAGPSASGISAGSRRSRDGGLQGAGSSRMGGNLMVGDSVLACANEQLAKLERLLREKDMQLEASRECLKNTREENQKIKQILGSQIDCKTIKQFKDVLCRLSKKGCMEKCEQDEIKCLINNLESMSKHIEVIKAENCNLKRLVQKLQCRIGLDDLKIEKETCTDVNELQNKVTRLQKELCLLRKYEEEGLKKVPFDNQKDDYVKQVETICQERDELRRRCERLRDMEGRYNELQKIAKEYESKSGCLSQSLNSKNKYICDMEHQMKQMHDFYEGELSKEKCAEDDLKCQIEQLRCELSKIRSHGGDSESLRDEIACLRQEIMKRDIAISDYECQYKQLMYKIKIFKSYGYRMPSFDEFHNDESPFDDNDSCCCCQEG